jgi:hypothetical protein
MLDQHGHGLCPVEIIGVHDGPGPLVADLVVGAKSGVGCSEGNGLLDEGNRYTLWPLPTDVIGDGGVGRRTDYEDDILDTGIEGI